MSLVARIALNVVACGAILAASVAGFLALTTLRPAPEKRQATEQVYNVQVYQTEPLNLQEIVSGFGTAQADQEVIVTAQVTGEIVDLDENLRIGTALREANARPLVQIDQRPFLERLQRVRSQLAESQAELDRLQQEEANNKRLLTKARLDLDAIQEQYERILKNRERGAASASEVTRALLEVRQYEQAIIQLENEAGLLPARVDVIERRRHTQQADLKLAQLDLENTTVHAPFDGSISEVMVEKGQYVRAGDPLLRLTNTSFVEIPLPLALSDFLKIEQELLEGRLPEVELAVNETAPPQWRGQVVRVSPEVDSNTRTAMVFVEVRNQPAADGALVGQTTPRPLRPGTFVHARISGPILTDAIVIPRDAVTRGRVFVAKDGHAEQRIVRTGTRLQSLVLIEDGLEDGDRVVLTNLDVIRPGVRVDVQDSLTLTDELAKQRTTAVRVLPESGG